MLIRKTLLAFFCLISIHNYAQQMMGDTITIYIENKVELKIAIHDFAQLKDSSSFITKHLEKFQKDLAVLASAQNGLKPEVADKLVYIPNEKIVLEKIDKKEIFQLEGSEVINTGFRDQAELTLGEVTAYITTDDLGDLGELDLAGSVVKMIDSLPEKSRYSVHQFFQYKDERITVLENEKKGGNSEDIIELSFDAGANLIKNKLVGDIELRLGLTFSKKGIAQMGPYTTLTFMYDFPNNRKTNINLFLNAGYDFYDDNKFSIGVEYGYLIRRQGDFFESGTTRLGLNISSESKLNLTPYMYFDKGFKKAYPGLRLGLNF